ncbi:hypothetical protein [Donghicola eburneus]|nr:hypothetical protein [Donghicola eburneus]SFQ55746.1 chromosome partitioning protein, ParB family [Donghicola eburneus]
MYTISADGRRFPTLELLLKTKRINKTVMASCIVRTHGLAE